MRTYKVIAGYECGGPEDGMMCRCGECFYVAEDAEDARSMCDIDNADDPQYLGCRVEEPTDAEIKEWYEWLMTEPPF